MDEISALFSDWASGLSGGGGGGELSVVAVSRMSISTPEGVCERESMGAEATPRNTRSPAREETTGGTRSGRTLCGWSGEAGGSEGRSEYDQLGERHGASEHETACRVRRRRVGGPVVLDAILLSTRPTLRPQKNKSALSRVR